MSLHASSVTQNTSSPRKEQFLYKLGRRWEDGWIPSRHQVRLRGALFICSLQQKAIASQQVLFNTSLDEVLQCCRFLIAVITAWEQLSSHYQTFLLGESSVLLINSHEVISLWKNLPGWFHTTEISSQVCSHTFRVHGAAVSA